MIQSAIHQSVRVPAGKIFLPGEIDLPPFATSVVLFSHGSGSSRLSPRNQFVARYLRKNGIGTFLFDLLTPEEDQQETRFDIELLTNRLLAATDWVLDQPFLEELNIGYFGASTGAASALNAAARLGERVYAVVSRGGRPDLALPSLPEVKASTLLIVGSRDPQVLELNRLAFARLHGQKELIIVPGASHLFEEDNKLEEVARHASKWFSKYMIEAVV